MTEENTLAKWIEAGIKLGRDPLAKVECPVCEHRYLRVFDVSHEESQKIDRHMICDNCGARNILTMSGTRNR